MMWTITLHDDVETWLGSLDADSYDQVLAALEILAEVGPSLGRPLVDTVKGSIYKNMKELRPGSSGRSEVRILFAFDRERRAVLLAAGDKSARWSRWYRDAIPLADQRFNEHIQGVPDA